MELSKEQTAFLQRVQSLIEAKFTRNARDCIQSGFSIYNVIIRILGRESYIKGDVLEMEKLNSIITWYHENK